VDEVLCCHKFRVRVQKEGIHTQAKQHRAQWKMKSHNFRLQPFIASTKLSFALAAFFPTVCLDLLSDSAVPSQCCNREPMTKVKTFVEDKGHYILCYSKSRFFHNLLYYTQFLFLSIFPFIMRLPDAMLSTTTFICVVILISSHHDVFGCWQFGIFWEWQ